MQEQAQDAGPYIDPEEVRRRIEDHITHASSGQRTIAERYWRANLKAYAGEPFWRVDNQGEVWVVDPDYRSDYVYVNLAFSMVQTLAGRMIIPVKVEASTAASPDMEDTFRARGAADLGNHIRRAGNLDEAIAECEVLQEICGHSWVKVGWDPGAGRRRPVLGSMPCPTCQGQCAIAHPQTGAMVPCPTCGTEGDVSSPTGEITDVVGEEPEGEVFFECVAPWEVYPDPEAKNLRKCRVIVHEMPMSRRQAWEMYCKDTPITEKDLENEEGESGESSYTIRMGDEWMKPARRAYVRVREYWSLPCDGYDDGIYGVQVGSIMVKAGPLPYAHNKLPFVAVTCHEMHGALYPRSSVDMVLPLIHQINEHMSNINARARQSVHMRVLANRKHGISLTDKPGVVLYTHVPNAPAPQELQAGPPPSDAHQMVEYLVKYVDDVSGAVDVMRGNQQPGVESAKAAAWFEEQAMGRIKPKLDRHARAWEEAVRLGISTAKLFYGDGRTIRVFGPMGAAENKLFTLDAVGDSEDVVISIPRDLGRSRSVRMQELNEAMNMQVIDAETYLEKSELVADGSMHYLRRAHENCAMMENISLREQGMMTPANPRDDHRVHDKVHLPLLLELRTNAPDDPRLAAIEAHMAEHEKYAQQAQMQQMMMQNTDAAAFGQAGASDPAAQPDPSLDAAAAAGNQTAETQQDSGEAMPPPQG